jgi:outer membrane lipoprotein SlyB
MKKYFFVIAIIASITSQAQAQNKTRQGAVAGGLAGAVVGGIIGHQNDETPEGALIGGAVGAIAGGMIGNAKDKQIARERYYQHELNMQQHQIYAQQEQIHALNRTGCVTMAEVITMSRTGVSDSVIINHIHSKGVDRRLEVSEIIHLHQEGVSEGVINAMQNARLASAPVTTYRSAPRQTSTVIIHENVPTYHPPRVYHHNYSPYRSHYHPSYRRPF